MTTYNQPPEEPAAHTPIVFVVQASASSTMGREKDFSDAKRFGTLEGIFLHSGWNDFDALIVRAHQVLRKYEDGDYLLMVGDPMLCGIAMAVALEYSDNSTLNILRWNRLRFRYEKATLNFGLIDENEDNDGDPDVLER